VKFLTGITWLDWAMALITVVGLWFTWRQARKATTAAKAAEAAVTTTRSKLIAVDLANEFRLVREAIQDVEAATEDNNPEVAKFVLVQLAEGLRRAVTLARDTGSPEVAADLLEKLDNASRGASTAKAELSKRATPGKVRTYTGALIVQLNEITHYLVEFETIQKYAVEGES
jgi:hypothetical protein